MLNCSPCRVVGSMLSVGCLRCWLIIFQHEEVEDIRIAVAFQPTCLFSGHLSLLKKKRRLWAGLETFINKMADVSIKQQVLSICWKPYSYLTIARFISQIESRGNNVIVLHKTASYSKLYLILFTDTSKTQRSYRHFVNNHTLLRYSLSTKQLDYELEISIVW